MAAKKIKTTLSLMNDLVERLDQLDGAAAAGMRESLVALVNAWADDPPAPKPKLRKANFRDLHVGAEFHLEPGDDPLAPSSPVTCIEPPVRGRPVYVVVRDSNNVVSVVPLRSLFCVGLQAQHVENTDD
jgi:hypothetical protein